MSINCLVLYLAINVHLILGLHEFGLTFSFPLFFEEARECIFALDWKKTVGDFPRYVC